MEVFSRYTNLKVNVGSTVSIIDKPKNFREFSDLINLKYAILYRDELIAATLEHFNVKHLVDIGSDFGNLISVCREYGIDGFGIEPNKDALKLCQESGVKAHFGDYDSIIENPEELREKNPKDGKVKSLRAISLLNVYSGNWVDLTVRKQLIKACLEETDFLVLTCNKKDLFRLMEDFNLKVESYIGAVHKPISRNKAVLMQYGHPLFFKKLDFELKFWQKVTKGKFFHQERIGIYHRCTVMLRLNNENK